MSRILAVLTVKDEGPFLLEWLAHHKSIGFTDFLVLSNDCSDGTDAMLDRLHELGEITHVANPAPHQGGIQFAALKRAQKAPIVEEADWIIALDVDEFVNIHAGDGTVQALIDAIPLAHSIALTWRLFGNAGVVEFEDKPILEQFPQAAPEVLFWPWRASLFKTLFRNDGTYQKLGVHRPRQPDAKKLDRAQWFDGSGLVLPSRFKTKGMFTPPGRNAYTLAQINHYPLGSMQSFVVKSARGRAVHSADQLGMDYWVERNWNQVNDSSIQRTAPKRRTIFKTLMKDPILADLHHAAVAWRRARFLELMKDEAMRSLYGRLLMTPPSQTPPPDQVRALYGFAQSAAKADE